MKATLTVIVILMILNASGQNTTQTEYNYMKTGYKTTEESGLDIKKGYYTEEIPDQAFTNVSITGIILKRTADNSIAGTILKVKEKTLLGGTSLYYYAMPAANTKTGVSFGWSNFNKDVEQMTTYQKNAVAMWTAYQLGYYMSTAAKK